MVKLINIANEVVVFSILYQVVRIHSISPIHKIVTFYLFKTDCTNLKKITFPSLKSNRTYLFDIANLKSSYVFSF